MKRFVLPLSLLALFVLTQTARASGPVLIVGDERVQGRFGEILEQKLRQKDGTPSSRVSACGLTVLDWLQGAKTDCGYFEKKLSGEIIQSKEASVAPFITFLSDTKPEFIIFIHGNRGLDTPAKALQAQIELVGRLLAASKTGCLWMGPSEDVSSRITNLYYNAIRTAATAAGCAVIDAPLFASMIEGDNHQVDTIVEIVVEMISVGREL